MATETDSFHWLAGQKEYHLALSGTRLICKNPKGKKLSSVPKWLKETELAIQLTALKDWLVLHRQKCGETVEQWMLRSLPVPTEVLASVWKDETWEHFLSNLIVCSINKSGNLDQETAGFFRGVDKKKGVGIVDLDGETQWLKTKTIAIPHPILLDELDDFRTLATELKFVQNTEQLFREIWSREKSMAKATAIDHFSGGDFAQLNHAMSLCRKLGYLVRGGNATCSIWENHQMMQARFWVGSDYPEAETTTGDLMFVDEAEKTVSVKDVGDVALSEGMRMAAAIYAKRIVKTADD